MSISDSLYIGVSGLTTMGNAISVVGDNIANASTVGYKEQRAEFADVLGGTIGSQTLGGGVRMQGVQTEFSQGALQQTGNALDLAIQGGGMFQVKGNYDGQTGGTFYTRAGNFSMDSSGYVVNPDGMRLQGYMINSAGVASTQPGDLDLGGSQSPPVATTEATIDAALNSNAPVNTTFDPANPVATATYSTPVTVHDSLGNAHQVNMNFVNNGGGNWSYTTSVDGSEVTGGTPGVPSQIGSGTLTFNTAGALVTQTGTTTASFVGATAGQAIKLNFGDDITSGGTGETGSTQYAGTAGSTVMGSINAVDADGRASGSLTSVAVGTDGTITGTYDNGDKINIAQVAIASFANQDGLVRAGDSLMSASSSSGNALLGAAGSGARGSLQAGSLESSNVDLGTELVTLIAYQRAFDSNSKTVTTADQMLQTVDNLKQ